MNEQAVTDPIFTVGHSNRSLGEFIEVLRSADVRAVIDIRRFPASRRHPHFNSGPLRDALASSGITYRHFPELGGYRVNPETLAASSNDAWPEGFLRNYADYAMTDAFQGALDRLTGTLQPRSVLMCAEKQWRDCHRQIVADHLISSGHHLVHLIEAHMHEAAILTPFATRCAVGTICYPAAHSQLRLDL